MSPAIRRLRARAGMATIAAAGAAAAAYRFALVYRVHAGYPRRRLPRFSPAEFGLDFEEMVVASPGGELPAWFVPARGGASGPAVLLVHGWESARDRMLPNIQFLNAAGFHCLTFDVRGHGANPAEELPISVAEFGADAIAALETLLARREVTRAGILGHSLGGVGAIFAAATDARTAALVTASAPCGPVRLTRQTFRLARLRIPDLVAYPLAWLTTRVYVRPRGHAVSAMNASRALARFQGPVLLIHGGSDSVVPVSNLYRLEASLRAVRQGGSNKDSYRTLLIPGGQHSWLYEYEDYRRGIARFLTEALDGPMSPVEAEKHAAAVDCRRLPEDEAFAVADSRPRGLRVVREIVAPGLPSSPAHPTARRAGSTRS